MEGVMNTVEPLQVGDPPAIGPYPLIGRLGHGGMGVVYLSELPSGGRVAVKVVNAPHVADPEYRARFRQEVDAARRVNGVFTAAVIDADPDAGVPWLATEYIEGVSLEKHVKAHGPLTADDVWKLCTGVAEALVAIHAQQLVHRDLKPSNILLTDDGPRVIDFGIARLIEGTVITEKGFVVGTLGYVSPERLEGGLAVCASDVFSLGAVLCYAATGAHPFADGENMVAHVNHVVRGRPLLDGVRDRRLRQVIARCLAKVPAIRPTPEQLIRLAHAIREAPIVSNQPTPSARTKAYESSVSSLRASTLRESQTLTTRTVATSTPTAYVTRQQVRRVPTPQNKGRSQVVNSLSPFETFGIVGAIARAIFLIIAALFFVALGLALVGLPFGVMAVAMHSAPDAAIRQKPLEDIVGLSCFAWLIGAIFLGAPWCLGMAGICLSSIASG